MRALRIAARVAWHALDLARAALLDLEAYLETRNDIGGYGDGGEA